MTRRINFFTHTGDRPTSIERFETIHHSRQIFGEGEIATGKLPQGAHPRLAVVHRVSSPACSRWLSFCASTRSFLLPVFSNAFLRGSHTITLTTCGLSKSYSQAALVPSSNVTHKVPFNPWRNSRMVAAFVSIKDSITSFPLASLTAIDMLA